MDMKKIRSREEIKASMMEALKAGDTEAYVAAFDEICDKISNDIRAEVDQYRAEQDTEILANRGVRQLTSDEKNYYAKVIEAMRSATASMRFAGSPSTMLRIFVKTSA